MPIETPVTSPVTAVSPPADFHGSYQKCLQEAVEAGDALELARVLEERAGKVNINFYDKEGQTALHRGCQDGHLEIVKLLVKFGADVKLANKDGWSALHLAAYGGHQDITLYLISTFKR